MRLAPRAPGRGRRDRRSLWRNCMAVGSGPSGVVCAHAGRAAAPEAAAQRLVRGAPGLDRPCTEAVHRLTVLLQHRRARPIACCLHASFQTVRCTQCVAKKFSGCAVLGQMCATVGVGKHMQYGMTDEWCACLLVSCPPASLLDPNAWTALQLEATSLDRPTSKQVAFNDCRRFAQLSLAPPMHKTLMLNT
jgi:hypothetical protein